MSENVAVISDLIFRSQWKNPGEPFTLYFQERNGSSGRATGLELSWQQALSFLPGPLDGLGVNVNATFIRGSSELDELVPGTMASYRKFTVDFLPEQPKRVYNAQVWWEKYGVSARVAFNYIGEFVRTSGGLTSFSMNDAATRVDCSLSYRLNRRFTDCNSHDSCVRIAALGPCLLQRARWENYHACSLHCLITDCRYGHGIGQCFRGGQRLSLRTGRCSDHDWESRARNCAPDPPSRRQGRSGRGNHRR